MFFEMHKHTQYSLFDGFDKIQNVVSYAKELGMKAMGIADHGNACGILQLYTECKKQGLKPLMGCEVYFQPKFDKEKRYFHLCLFAKNNIGYQHLCALLSEANETQFYKTAKVTPHLLEKYHEGLICTSACVAGYIPQMFIQGRNSENTFSKNKYFAKAMKVADWFKRVFGNDFYLEIQPMEIDEKQTQKYVNEHVMKLGEDLGIKCILTTDSHYTRPDDFETYIMMHRMSKIGQSKGEGFTIEHVQKTYKERYMHSEKQIVSKFNKMHPNFNVNPLLKAMDEIYNKIDVELDFSESIPDYDGCDDCYKEMKHIAIKRLKEIGKFNKKYIDRLKYEMSVIKDQNLCDYFMIVYDYVKHAREIGCYIGPGRGSVCGSLVPYALQITKVDPLVLGNDFERFLRPDKKKMPDIDLDFETTFQSQVMEYIIKRYPGRASKVITFGYYKGANLINDLAKIYDISGTELERLKSTILPLLPKSAHFDFEDIKWEDINKNPEIKSLNREYPHIVEHFCKLCGQVRYYGQHPAGVLVTKGKISKYVPMMKVKDHMICAYDKYDVEGAGMVKFDILALRTMNIVHDIESIAHDKYEFGKANPEVLNKMYQNFSEGKTLGIFQLNKQAAQDILRNIHADNLQDLIAAISLNRPGPLKLKMHEQYATNKENPDTDAIWYPYTKDAFGSIIYQEHVMRICKGLADMDPNEIDKIMKFKFSDEEREKLKTHFVEGAKKVSHMKESVACNLFDSMTLYLFNKGHASGYAMISEWEMYHKVMNPIAFWYATMKNEINDINRSSYMSEAVVEGNIIFLPHVNYSADFSIRKVDGEPVIQQGYNSIKNVGVKAAEMIETERKTKGPFRSYDDFIDRCKSRSVTSRVVDSLVEQGALEFNKKTYINRVKKFNAALYSRGLRYGKNK